jgi:hypothetical protein
MQNITLSKETEKRLSKEEYYSKEMLLSDIQDYIKALKEGRLQYLVMSVSPNGMSRNILIQSCEQNKTNSNFYFRQYSRMFEMLGYKLNKDYYLKVSGCGMNMLFATNYYLIQTFKNMNIITDLECEILTQKIN